MDHLLVNHYYIVTISIRHLILNLGNFLELGLAWIGSTISSVSGELYKGPHEMNKRKKEVGKEKWVKKGGPP